MSDRNDLQTVLILGAVLVGGVLLWRFSKVAGGIVTGNNGITRTATDAAGRPVTAYQGAGVAGTLGATVNAATGGAAASAGRWLGDLAFDWFGPRPDSGGQGASATQPTGWDYSGKDQTFEQASSEDGWWPYPLIQLGGMPTGVS